MYIHIFHVETLFEYLRIFFLHNFSVDIIKDDLKTDLLETTKDFTTISNESIEEDKQKGKAI